MARRPEAPPPFPQAPPLSEPLLPPEKIRLYEQFWGKARSDVELFLRQDENQELAYKLSQYRAEMTRRHYDPRQIQQVHDAQVLSCLHQLNQHPKDEKKYRKEGGMYIEHPYAMSLDSLNMYLHGADIAADYTHDVVEDVIYEDMQTPEDWLDFMAWKFRGYDKSERTMRILRAENATKSFDRFSGSDKEALIQAMGQTPHGRLCRAEALAIKQILGFDQILTPEDEENIAKVTYDMTRLYAEAFKGKDSDIDPDGIAVIAAKIRDTADNLRTPAFWSRNLKEPKKITNQVIKYLRARTLTNTARFLGMRSLSSEMALNLSKLGNPYDIYQQLGTHAPVIEEDGIDHDEYLSRLNTQLFDAHLPSLVNHNAGKRPDSHQWFEIPWGTDMRDSGITRGKPPIANITLPVGSPEHEQKSKLALTNAIEQGGQDIEPPLRTTRDSVTATRLTPSTSFLAVMQGLTGRSTTELKLTDITGETDLARVQLETINAALISLLKHNSKIKPSEVPESRLLHPDVCTYTIGPDTLKQMHPLLRDIDMRFAHLAAFMLSPRIFLEMPATAAHVVFIKTKGGMKMYLSTNDHPTSIRDMCADQGVTGELEYRTIFASRWTHLNGNAHDAQTMTQAHGGETIRGKQERTIVVRSIPPKSKKKLAA